MVEGRAGGRAGVAQHPELPFFQNPQEEGDSEQDDDGGARQDEIHVSNMETLQVDRVQVAT